VASFGLAVNQKEKVCFVDVVVFSKLASSCAEYLKKGKSVFVEGKLKLSTWEQEGKKRNKLEVIARTIQFLSPREERDETSY